MPRCVYAKLPYCICNVIYVADVTDAGLKPETDKEKEKSNSNSPKSDFVDADQVIKDDQIKAVAKSELAKGGVISPTIGSFLLIYTAISNLILYPTFTFLFFLMIAVMGFLIVQTFSVYSKGGVLEGRKWLSITILAFLIHMDIYLVAYEKGQIFFLFLTLQKDIVFIAIATIIGFMIGKMYSKSNFEENVVP